jgi:IS605 OrfB family transposase
MIKTLKFRVKDNAKGWLTKLAKEVNFVWGYVNDLSYKSIKNKGKFLTAFDMSKYLKGATKTAKEDGLNLHAQTLQTIAKEYVVKRKASGRRKLRWRKSHGTGKALGWVPFQKDSIRIKNNNLYYGKYRFKIWDSYGLKDYELRSGSFNEDSEGKWYFNVCVDVDEIPSNGVGEIGIDLGLKDFATLSTGEKIETQRFYRDQEGALGQAQRANKRRRVKAIHRAIKNRRKDFLHKTSTKLIEDNKLIVIGDVSSSKLVKTSLAKSVLDAGWGMFKNMLMSKAIRRLTCVKVINEMYTTLTCNVCKEHTGPKGLGGLGIREWACINCGAVHDRDVNSAINILRLGHQTPVVGITCLQAG